MPPWEADIFIALLDLQISLARVGMNNRRITGNTYIIPSWNSYNASEYNLVWGMENDGVTWITLFLINASLRYEA